MFVILEIARITETMRQPSEKSESKGSGLLKKHNTNFKHSNLREGETGAEAQMEAEYVIHVISTFSTVTEDKQVLSTCSHRLVIGLGRR